MARVADAKATKKTVRTISMSGRPSQPMHLCAAPWPSKSASGACSSSSSNPKPHPLDSWSAEAGARLMDSRPAARVRFVCACSRETSRRLGAATTQRAETIKPNLTEPNRTRESRLDPLAPDAAGRSVGPLGRSGLGLTDWIRVSPLPCNQRRSPAESIWSDRFDTIGLARRAQRIRRPFCRCPCRACQIASQIGLGSRSGAGQIVRVRPGSITIAARRRVNLASPDLIKSTSRLSPNPTIRQEASAGRAIASPATALF